SIHVELGGDIEFRSTDANHTLKLKFFRVFWARFKSNSWHSTRPKAINETGKQIRCVKRTGTTKNRTQHWNCLKLGFRDGLPLVTAWDSQTILYAVCLNGVTRQVNHEIFSSR